MSGWPGPSTRCARSELASSSDARIRVTKVDDSKASEDGKASAE